jgi:hypothetical protein
MTTVPEVRFKMTRFHFILSVTILSQTVHNIPRPIYRLHHLEGIHPTNHTICRRLRQQTSHSPTSTNSLTLVHKFHTLPDILLNPTTNLTFHRMAIPPTCLTNNLPYITTPGIMMIVTTSRPKSKIRLSSKYPFIFPFPSVFFFRVDTFFHPTSNKSRPRYSFVVFYPVIFPSSFSTSFSFDIRRTMDLGCGYLYYSFVINVTVLLIRLIPVKLSPL